VSIETGRVPGNLTGTDRQELLEASMRTSARRLVADARLAEREQMRSGITELIEETTALLRRWTAVVGADFIEPAKEPVSSPLQAGEAQ
jgi:hypothetical protein